MIMAENSEQRKDALDLLLPYQRSDFEGIFHVMDGEFSSLINSLFYSKGMSDLTSSMCN